MRLGEDIAQRLLRVGLAALRIATGLEKNIGSQHLAMQLIRAATGAGANYEEARAAESRADFIHKVGIAAKMREAYYWLNLIGLSGWFRQDVSSVIREAAELVAILGASARTARKSQPEK